MSNLKEGDMTQGIEYQKLYKLQQEQNALLSQRLDQTNELLSELVKVSSSGSTVASGKKFIPFQSGSQLAGQLLITPTNPDDYPTKIDLYSINDNRVIPHMTLVNDGPGELFFINAYGKNSFNTQEGHLNVNDQRELFNVYEVRLRSTLPLTTFRLIEGIFRTGSFSPFTKANVEVRPTVQANEVLKTFIIQLDSDLPATVNIPTPQTYPQLNTINPTFFPPLPPGQSAALVDNDTGMAMPFLIPEGFILEAFSIIANFSTEFTFRNFLELVPGTYSLISTSPASNRGFPMNLVLSLGGQFSSQVVDPFGAPLGGRRSLATITNDDPFNNMIGFFMAQSILRRLV